MRALAVLLVLLVLPGGARAEDTAVVLSSLNDEAAERRYLDELCRRVGVAEPDYVRAIGADTECQRLRGTCPEGFDGAARNVAAAKGAYDAVRRDYDLARAVFRAKRDIDPTNCTAEGDARIAAAQQGNTTEREKPRGMGAERADCERACNELGAGEPCLKNCARYDK